MGTGEILDAAEALGHIERLSREDFRMACRSTLVKRWEDLSVFDEAFEEFWRAEASLEESREEAEGSPAMSQPKDVPMPWGRAGEARPEAIALPIPFRYSPEGTPRDSSLGAVQRRRLEAMRRVARSFRRWAATREGRRFERRHGGEVDFPRTVRGSLRFGGEWVDLRRRGRRRSRTHLVVLWDISGSMEEYGPFLFPITHSLVRAIPSARVLAFSTQVVDLTPAFTGRPYPEALRRVSGGLQGSRGGTRIGKCLQDFNKRYGGLVDRRTVVMILSDGWDLGELEVLDHELRVLHRRCHRLVWVNPHSEASDYRPEVAGMRTALPYVDLLIPPSALARRHPLWMVPDPPLRSSRVEPRVKSQWKSLFPLGSRLPPVP